MNIAKKTLSTVVATTTILWSMGASMLVGTLTANAAATDGSLIKAQEFDAVYYYQGGKRWTFPNLKTYSTWYPNFSGVQTIPLSELQTYQLAGNVVYRPGTRLVKITTDPKVYAVAPNGQLRWIKDGATAEALYGANWTKLVDDVSDAFFTNYSIGADISSTTYPDGTLLSNAGSYYYIQGGQSRAVDTASLAGNHLNTAYAIAVSSLASYPAGTALGASEVANSAQAAVAGQTGGTTGGTTVSSNGSLTISLASDSPSYGNSIVVNTATNVGGQKLARMTKVNFTANGGDVVVTQVQATRGGISKDGDVDYLYLADANGNVIAKNNSFSLGVATFLNSAGLFTVPAGQTVSVWVLEDVNQNAGVGSTQSWSVNTSGIVTNSSGTVTGSAMGASFTVASVSDLGRLWYASSSPVSPVTVDAGKTNYTLGTFKFGAQNQDVLLKSVKFTQIGSIATTDLANLKVQVAGVQYDVTKALGTNNTLTVDFSKDSTGAANADGGLKILAGQTKFVDIIGDIVGGTNRNFKFSVQNSEDVSAWDLNYKVYIGTVDYNTSAFAVETLAASTINTGTLSVSLASDSPTLNVALNGTNVLLSKFNLTAAGEDVKLTSLTVYGTSADSNLAVKNVKILLDGVQVGSTVASSTAKGPTGTEALLTQATFTFTNNFIVRTGKTSVLTVYGDLNDTSASNAGQTISMSLLAGSSNAQGLTSLTSISSGQTPGYTLTLKTGAPSASQNAAVPNATATEPTATVNAHDAVIGSFILTGGAGEASKITSIALTDNAAALNTYFSRLRIEDASGALLSPELATGGASSTYTFTISPALNLAKGEQKVVNVVADILAPASATALNPAVSVKANGVTYQTVDTAQTGTMPAAAFSLQNVYIALAGTLTAAISSDTPVTQQIVEGTQTQPIFKFTLTGGKSEDINVSEIATSFKLSASTTPPTGLLQNLRLMDGDTVVGTVAALTSGSNPATATAGTDTSATSDASNGYAHFTALNSGAGVIVPKNGSKTLTVVATIASTQDVYSNISVTGYLLNGYDNSATPANAIVAKGAMSGTVISSVTGDGLFGKLYATAIAGNALTALRTKLSVAYSSSSNAPGTTGTRTTEMPAALFVISNSANVNNAKATISKLNFLVSGSLSQLAGASQSSALKVYKSETVDSTQQLEHTTLDASITTSCGFGTAVNAGSCKAFGSGGLALNDTTSLVIDAGASSPVLVTLDTSHTATGNATLVVGMQAGDIVWSDGVTSGITTVNTLPLTGKSISFN